MTIGAILRVEGRCLSAGVSLIGWIAISISYILHSVYTVIHFTVIVTLPLPHYHSLPFFFGTFWKSSRIFHPPSRPFPFPDWRTTVLYYFLFLFYFSIFHPFVRFATLFFFLFFSFFLPSFLHFDSIFGLNTYPSNPSNQSMTESSIITTSIYHPTPPGAPYKKSDTLSSYQVITYIYSSIRCHDW